MIPLLVVHLWVQTRSRLVQNPGTCQNKKKANPEVLKSDVDLLKLLGTKITYSPYGGETC